MVMGTRRHVAPSSYMASAARAATSFKQTPTVSLKNMTKAERKRHREAWMDEEDDLALSPYRNSLRKDALVNTRKQAEGSKSLP